MFNDLHMQVHSPNDCASPAKPPSGASSAIAPTEEDIGEVGGAFAEPSPVKMENGCAAAMQMLQASVMENAQVRFTRRAC